MQRATTFQVGGGISIALGGALAAGLLWAGAGLAYFGAWLGVAFAVVIGVFFLRVARDEQRYRADYLAAVEAGRPPPPGGPPI